MRLHRVLLLVIAGCAIAASALAQTNHIDTVTAIAPELAAYGQYDIGVRTVQATDKHRPDILNTKNGAPTVFYDRTLTLEGLIAWDVTWPKGEPTAMHQGRRESHAEGRHHIEEGTSDTPPHAVIVELK